LISENRLREIEKYNKENGDELTCREYKINLETLNRYLRRIKESTRVLPEINGLMAAEHVDFENEILPYLEKIGQRAGSKNQEEASQEIIMPNEPFCIVLLSDIHGGGKIDYTKLKNDLDIIQQTDGMYVMVAGDQTDNFFASKLAWIQKEQPTTADMELRFIRWFFEKLKNSLLLIVMGNHDNWMSKMAGIEFTRELLKDVTALYDKHQIFFTLKWSGFKQKWLIRHKWRHSSVYNPTHGIEVGWERVGLNYDVAVGAHTHIATLHREFIRQNKKRHAILLGTYKIRDNFAREIGFPKSYGSGSAAIVYNTDGSFQFCENLIEAKNYLEFIRH